MQDIHTLRLLEIGMNVGTTRINKSTVWGDTDSLAGHLTRLHIKQCGWCILSCWVY